MAGSKKKSFLKSILKSILYLLILFVLLLIGIYLSAERIVKKAVTTFVPQVTQTAVKLDDVTLALLRGHIELKGFAIANPAGYAKQNVFVLKRIDVRFDPKSVFSDKIVVHSVLIDGTQVDAEATLDNNQIKSNLTDLNRNIQSFVGTPAQQSAKPTATSSAPATDGASKAVVIRDLQINNTALSVGVMGQTVDVPLPNIQQKNIGEKKHVSVQDAVLDILDDLTVESLKGTSKAVSDAVRKGLLDARSGLETKAKEKATGFINNLLGK